MNPFSDIVVLGRASEMTKQNEIGNLTDPQTLPNTGGMSTRKS